MRDHFAEAGAVGGVPRVGLTPPTGSGYIHLAAEVDRRPPFLWASASKRRLLRLCKEACARFLDDPSVIGAHVFRAVVIPPGRGRFLKQRGGQVHIARFDLAVLIEASSLGAARALVETEGFRSLHASVQHLARYTHLITATNVKRIGPVDPGAGGVFLFNYFFADDTTQNLEVWEETAGWFQQETGLDNSTVLLPTEESNSEYNIINHCRWDHLGAVLPSLLFKPSFRSYVLAKFEHNSVAAMPILYRVA